MADDGDGATTGTVARDRIETETDGDVLRKLELLCDVLGLSYDQRIKEFGIKGGNIKDRTRTKVLETIRSLELEKETRFTEARSNCRKLIAAWKSTHLPAKKAILAEAFAIIDAEVSNEVSDPGLLRISFEDELTKEIERLKHVENTYARAKYEATKKKMKNLLLSSHLVDADVEFELDKEVEDDKLSDVTWAMKIKIQKLKEIALKRKALVYRVDAVRRAIYEAWPHKAIKVLLERATKEAKDLRGNSCRPLKFEGLNIDTILVELRDLADSIHDAAAMALFEETAVTVVDFARSTTRSGARFSSAPTSLLTADRPDLASDLVGNSNSGWNVVDRKRIVNVVYRVKDLEQTVKCYEEDFRMNVLRRIEDPERKHSFAIVGFGPESNTFALKLAYYHDAQDFDIGDAFGNLAITCKVHEFHERIENSTSCKIACKPGRRNKVSPLIAVVMDPSGYLFELIETGPPTVHISHVMLRVKDLDRSVKFYQKSLGMKLAKRMDLPSYSCAIAVLKYDGGEHAACLQLTSNDGVQKYEHGNSFIEITICTDNVKKSIEAVDLATKELGGEVVLPEEAASTGQQQNTACFIDPDGYKVVLVDNVVFLDEVTAADGPDE